MKNVLVHSSWATSAGPAPNGMSIFHYAQNVQIHVFTSLQWLFSLHQWLQNAKISLGRLLFHPNWSKIDLPRHFFKCQLEKFHQKWILYLTLAKFAKNPKFQGTTTVPARKIIKNNAKVWAEWSHVDPSPLTPLNYLENSACSIGSRSLHCSANYGNKGHETAPM